MNRKTVFIFLLGFASSAILFGVVGLVQRSVSRIHEPVQAVLPTASLLPVQKQSLSLAEIPVPADTALKDSSTGSAVPIQDLLHVTETGAFKTFISPSADDHSVIHEVKAGDTLTSISKKYHVTIDLIRRINHIQNDKLILGAKLKIPTYKLSIVVDKSQNSLILKGDEAVLKTYVVSTGTNNSTPVGVFKVTNKLVNPTWYKPDGKVIPYGDPTNLLGTRWMGLTKKGYGIHGTTEPEKLGQQVTDGCIRMKNEEVEELYGFLTPGVEVTIVD